MSRPASLHPAEVTSPLPEAPPRRRRRPGAWLRSPATARRAFGVGLVTAGLLLAAGGPASAHNVLISTDPADGSTVPSAPDAVTLTFNEPAVALGTQIQVTGPDGSQLAVGEPQLVDSSVIQALGDERPAGAYQVMWRVTSADGHPIEGVLAFEASEAVGMPADDVTDPTEAVTDDGSGDDTVSPPRGTESGVAATEDAPDDGAPVGDADESDDADQSDDASDGGSLPGWVIPVGVLVLAAAVALVVRSRRE